MTLVVSYDDIGPDRINRNAGGNGAPASTNYRFFMASKERPDAPSAFLAHYPPDEHSTAHYHAVDQFQILVRGKGELGRHAVAPYYVHFARAYTPYGPLHADAETGWTFMTLRSRWDAGAQRLPDKLETLKQIPDRKPWQVTTQATFPPVAAGCRVSGTQEISDERGLFVHAFTLAPGVRAAAPAPSRGDGQYVVALNGSLLHEGVEKKAMTVTFVGPTSRRLKSTRVQRAAGTGAEFPASRTAGCGREIARQRGRIQAMAVRAVRVRLRRGTRPARRGHPAGTRWEDVPETWTCPDCAAGKSDFEMIEV